MIDLINLERVEIIDETEDQFSVTYKGQTYQIAKSDTSEFTYSSPVSMGAEMRLEQLVLPGNDIFQDDEVAQEFKEVMMFHEIREQEYIAAGFEDGHDRAVNDELLYILKFFDEETREQYLEFARTYRSRKDPSLDLDISDVFFGWLATNSDRGWEAIIEHVDSLLGERPRTPQELEWLIGMVTLGQNMARDRARFPESPYVAVFEDLHGPYDLEVRFKKVLKNFYPGNNNKIFIVPQLVTTLINKIPEDAGELIIPPEFGEVLATFAHGENGLFHGIYPYLARKKVYIGYGKDFHELDTGRIVDREDIGKKG